MGIKYRIENGTATVDISEINRLNDEGDKVSKLEEKLIKEREAINAVMKDNSTVILIGWQNTSLGRRRETSSLEVIGSLEARTELKKHRKEMVRIAVWESENEIKKEFMNMSVKEFKKWKK